MSSDPTYKYRELLDYLNRQGGAKVTDLSKELFLSESTVRRALSSLEAQGKVKRFHGGVAPVDQEAQSPVRRRRITYLPEKSAIGRLAATFVEDGMTLLMMGGTTVQAICPFLMGKRLTVITNSLPVVNELAFEERIQVILLGGVVNPLEMEARGEVTTHSLRRFRADMMFTGTTGLHPIHGLMTDDPNGVETYRTCMHISDQVIVLADHTKCERYGGTTVLCGLEEVACLITDAGLSDSVRAYFEKAVPKLLVAE